MSVLSASVRTSPNGAKGAFTFKHTHMNQNDISSIETPEPPQRKYPLEELKSSGKQGKKLGLALVGLGKYAEEEVMPALEQTSLVRLTAIVTGSPEKAEKYCERFGIKKENIYNYQNFDSIKDNPDVDLIYIVLPNSLHAEFTVRGAKAGKHVLCEKPMAIYEEQCEEMISACKEAGKMLFIGYRLHFEPHHREAMRLGQNQILGKVQKMEIGFGFDVGDPHQWRLNKKMAGGGSLMDVGIYAIQAACYTLGQVPVAISNAVIEESKDEKFKEVEDVMKWEMEFEDGTIAYCECSYSVEVDKIHAYTSGGWFKISPAFDYKDLSGETSEGKMDFQEINQQAAQLDGIAEMILNGVPNIVSPEEGLRDVKIIRAIYEAAEKGTTIVLDKEHINSAKLQR
jgi:predicted dehydrogenase